MHFENSSPEMKRLCIPKLLILTFFLSSGGFQTWAQTSDLDESYLQGLEWRNLGPYRGGRSNAVAGVPEDPLVYYFGATGGGVWKTEDAGSRWTNISDDYFQTGSIGAIAVAPSDPNVLYVGTGEHAVRGVMTSAGDGMYKSTDAGQSWQHIGLPNAHHIAAIVVHPEDPEVVYVAVQGALYGPSGDRGVYRSTDGGKNWEKVLFVHENAGACDLSMDLRNPRILYAGFWDHQRTPWEIRSGGPGSGIYKSKDGGSSWERLEKGLPEAMGKVAVSVSPADPQIVYANIEAEKGGVYRSMDGGKSWSQATADRRTITRAWYYTEIFADPVNPNTVYVLNAQMLRSIDGGKSFTPVSNPHTDQHDLWINPDDPHNMILANDGGACITFNGGDSWSTQANQPTAQFYRVITDRQFPYRVYGGQQDNSTVAIASRSHGSGIDVRDWKAVSGGESAFLAFDPDNPTRIYGNSIQGFIDVYDEKTGLVKDIMPYPAINLGTMPKEMKYRFNWNNPLISDPFEPTTIYQGAQLVLRSQDGGQSWDEISPDLTRNDSTRQGPGGFPYTNEAAGGENYNTLSYLEASTREKGVIWAGSDDGLIHITRDGGGSWKNVTPDFLEESLINAIDASPHRDGAAYVAVTRYKFMDHAPLILHTKDYGKSWTRIEGNLPQDDFVRVVREDQEQEGVLFAGTEKGFYWSVDNGGTWQSLQLNLPHLPVTDLTQADNDLVISTAGRGFWILDDISPLRQWATASDTTQLRLFSPAEQVRFWSGAGTNPPEGMGQTQPDGFPITYFLPKMPDSLNLQLRILDESGSEVIQYVSEAGPAFKPYLGGPPAPRTLPREKGLNRFYWDFRRATLPATQSRFVYGNYAGSHVGPGRYTLQLIIEGDTLTETCRLLPDPRMDAAEADYARQQNQLRNIESMASEIARSANQVQQLRQQFADLQKQLQEQTEQKELSKQAQELGQELSQWEEGLVQPKQKTFQDVINFPNKLLAETLNLKEKADSQDPRVPQGVNVRLEDLKSEWAAYRARLETLLLEVQQFNEEYRQKALPAILVPEELAGARGGM